MSMKSAIVMAGGSGGHVYPALAVAEALRRKGVSVSWLGAKRSLEQRLAAKHGFEFNAISMRQIWGIGLARWLALPFWLAMSVVQSVVIIFKMRPDVMLGVGGYVSCPGGIACWIMRRPLVIHESNTVSGLANRVLAGISSRVLTGFPETDLKGSPICVGNPVREEIVEAAGGQPDLDVTAGRKMRVLVIGGSQGAEGLNVGVPEAISKLEPRLQPEIMHQTGKGKSRPVADAYAKFGIEADVVEYIEDMAAAYLWADVAIARAGAMTSSEIAVMGLLPIFVPYPFAARNHQRHNAEYFVHHDCAYMIEQQETFAARVEENLRGILQNRTLVADMSRRLRQLAIPDATERIVKHCMDAMEA